MTPRFQTSTYTASTWGVSRQRVEQMISRGQIEGVVFIRSSKGKAYAVIPSGAKKPADIPGGRRRHVEELIVGGRLLYSKARFAASVGKSVAAVHIYATHRRLPVEFVNGCLYIPADAEWPARAWKSRKVPA